MSDRKRGVYVTRIGVHSWYDLPSAYAIAFYDDGTVGEFLICNEGVGCSLKSLGEKGARQVRATVVQTVIAYQNEGINPQQDLADFIRVFGSRLESNFDLWYRELSNRDSSKKYEG